MKIEETPFQFSNAQGAAPASKTRSALQGGADGFLDDTDLSFLSMLNSMGSLKGAVNKTVLQALDEEQAPAADKEKDPQKTTLRGETTVDTRVASTPTATRESTEAIEEHKKDLAALEDDITLSDIELLKTINPLCLPIQAPVPLQDLIPVDNEGKPEFERMAASKGLSQLIEKAYKTGRPVRVELENGSAIILKIKQGKVSAEFLTQDQAQALYLKQQLSDLRNRMEARNLPVGTLDSRQEQPKRRRQDDDEDTESPASRADASSGPGTV